MKKKLHLLLLFIVALASWRQLNAQQCNITTGITIGQQDFEDAPAQPELPTSKVDTIFVASTGDGAFPNDPMYVSGSKGVQVNNATGNIIFGPIDTSKYENISFTIHLASFASSSSEGADAGDFVRLSVKNGSAAYSKELVVKGKDYGNNRWSFTSGTGIAEVVYDGDNSVQIFQPTTSGDVTTEGYSTLKITNLPITNSLEIKLRVENTNSDEIWVLDDAVLTGDQKDYTVWNNSNSTWSNGVPDETKKAFFDTAYNMTLSGRPSVTACECQIKSGKTVTIKDGEFLKIGNDIINNGTIKVEDGGSLVQLNDNATVSGSGNYTVEVKTSSMPDARYSYLSTPTESSTLNVFSSWAYPGALYAWDGINQSWSAVTFSDTMTVGLGYAIGANPSNSFPAEFLTEFHSAFNNGIITQNIYNTNVYSGTDDDNTLVGNPYPSAISSANVLSKNADVNALYFWSHSNSQPWNSEQYLLWNNAGSTNGAPATISTGQGFFVDSNNTGTITFDNSLRLTTGNNTFLRSPQENDFDKVWLNLVSNTNVGSQILIAFFPNTTNYFDSQYDAPQFLNGNAVNLTSRGVGVNTQNLGIQSRGLLNDNDTIIPLNVTIDDNNITSLTISIDHFENLIDANIYLRDLQLNTITDLKLQGYIFAVNQTGIIQDRFEIVFSRNALSTNTQTLVTSNDLIVANSNQQILVKVKKGKMQNIQVYDIVGKLVTQVKVNTNEVYLDAKMANGAVYFVKVTLENGQVLNKKFIKM